MSVFKCFDDPENRPRLVALGITDDDFVKYAARRSRGLKKKDALDRLFKGKRLSWDDKGFVLSLLEQLPAK